MANSTSYVHVTSHFTGLKTGLFYDKVMVDLPNKDSLKIDFNKCSIKGKSSLVEISKESADIKYVNKTSDKKFGDIFDPKKMTKLSIKGKTPVDLFVDFQTRYVHLQFPETVPIVHECSGLLVEPQTHLN